LAKRWLCPFQLARQAKQLGLVGIATPGVHANRQPFLHESRTTVHWFSSVLDEQILRHERYTLKRINWKSRLTRCASLVVHRVDNGIDLGIESLDMANGFFEQFKGRNLPLTGQFSQSKTILLAVQ